MHPYPRKRFGQHFLCDQSVIHKIVQALSPKKDEQLIEIGPGQGALTLPVLKITKNLEVVELDKDLILPLKKRCELAGKLTIYEADALSFDFSKLTKNHSVLRVFGNLPYNISTPLIFHLLSFTDSISDMLFMLQKEVAERIVAKPNSKAYGRLSVMVQYHCESKVFFDVGSEAFFPPPKVQSSIIHLIPYRKIPYRVNDYSLFEKVVKAAFSKRRKTLRNSLKELVSDELWSRLKMNSDLRAENLSVKDFVELCNAM